MSYILDALRRADSERERGAVPGLHAQAIPLRADGAGESAPPATRAPAGRWLAVGIGLGLLAALGAGWLAWGGDAADAPPATAAAPVDAREADAAPSPQRIAQATPAPAAPGASLAPARAAPTAGTAPAANADATPTPAPAVRPSPRAVAETPRSVPAERAPRTAGRSAATLGDADGAPGAGPRSTASARAAPAARDAGVEASATDRPSRAADRSPAERGTDRMPAERTATAPPAAARVAPAAAPPQNVAAARTAAATGGPAATAADVRIYAPHELPEDVRRQLPRISIGGSVYSESAASRFLIVNGQVRHEGDEAAPEVTLERIKLRSAVLNFRGYRYELSY